MNGSSVAQRLTDERDTSATHTFLGSHRALAVCAREVARLSTDIIRTVASLQDSGVTEKPAVRQSPNRCIVQLGPVALTVTWLRGTIDSAADGELLTVVWSGAVAPPSDRLPEHAGAGPTRGSAVPVWEEVLLADGVSETSWRWLPRDAADHGYSSSELAARCVERLHAAYCAARGPAALPAAS